MASGHVNRTYRPNTWLHRQMLQTSRKSLPTRSQMVWTPPCLRGEIANTSTTSKEDWSCRSSELVWT
jgi:hypothetical protein